MRAISFHRRAARYLARMPKNRAIQVKEALKEVAELEDIASHSGIKQMSGEMANWSRLRIGGYRAILKVSEVGRKEVLYVDTLGPRGDVYKG